MTSRATWSDIESSPGTARRILFSLLCASAMSLGGGAACSGSDNGSGEGDDGAAVDGGGGGGGGGDGSGGGSGDGSGGGGGGGTCEGPFGPPRDPSGFPECCQEFGPAHCIPSDEIDPAANEFLEACDDASFCVPDVYVEAGADYDLISCASVGGEGVCLSLCIPLVAENGDLLPQDICAANEKCVPCISPLDGMPTGACEIELSCDEGGGGGGAADAGPGGGGGLEACCDDRGTCIPAELAGDQAENLEQDTCSDEEQLCAPNDLIDQSFVAEPCESTIGGLGGDPAGACMHDCLANTGIFLQDGCADGFKCVACELPILGETGACDFLPGN